MADKVSGRDLRNVLNSILSESIWGSYDTEDTVGINSWKPQSSTPSATPSNESYVSFGYFLETIVKCNKHDRNRLKGNFTENGFIGSSFKIFYNALLEAMKPEKDSESFYSLTPSFFHFITYLIQRDINFRIIFRTFGDDTNEVIHEYNSFLSGNHPYFIDMYSKCIANNPITIEKARLLQIDPTRHMGKLNRVGHAERDIVLTMKGHVCYI